MDCRSRLRLIIFSILSLAWMGVIFFFSAQSGESSDSQSGFVVDIIKAVLPFNISDEGIDTLSFLVRKLAHFTEYAILGIFYIQTLIAGDKRERELRWLIISALMCFIYAVTDEFHQSFTDGRSPAVMDVFIDTAGGLSGAAICVAVRNIVLKRKERIG